MPDLRGQVAIVTGSTKGIGRAIVEALADVGVDVVVSARHEKEVADAAKAVGARGGGRTLGIPCDVRDRDQVHRLIDGTVRELGRLDILVNNAGVGAFAPIDELAAEDWHRVLDTNLTGVYYCCHAAVPHMRRGGGGCIINLGSLAGRYAMAGGTVYNASKWGLVGFSEALMLDVRDDGIRVSCVMPGTVDTYFRDRPPSGESWKLTSQDVALVVLQLLQHDPRSLPSKVELRPARPPKS